MYVPRLVRYSYQRCLPPVPAVEASHRVQVRGLRVGPGPIPLVACRQLDIGQPARALRQPLIHRPVHLRGIGRRQLRGSAMGIKDVTERLGLERCRIAEEGWASGCP